MSILQKNQICQCNPSKGVFLVSYFTNCEFTQIPRTIFTFLCSPRLTGPKEHPILYPQSSLRGKKKIEKKESRNPAHCFQCHPSDQTRLVDFHVSHPCSVDKCVLEFTLDLRRGQFQNMMVCESGYLHIFICL